MSSINEDQIDLATGDHLDELNTAGWDSRMAHMLGAHNNSDLDFHLDPDKDIHEDFMISASSNTRKRKAVVQLSASSGSSIDITPPLTTSLEWKGIWDKYADNIKTLLDACRLSSSAQVNYDDLKQDCKQMIRKLREIPKPVWENALWREQLRKSEFMKAVWRLQYVHLDPQFNIPPALLPLWRQCAIFNSISVLLVLYYRAELPQHPNPSNAPKLWPDTSTISEGDLCFYYSSDKDLGRKLVNVLLEHPDAIPLHTNPSSAFFLSSQPNFVEAYDDWLRCALVLRGVQVRSLGTLYNNIANQTQVKRNATDVDIRAMYRAIMKYLSETSCADEWKESYIKALKEEQGNHIKNPPLIFLKCILSRTASNSKEYSMAQKAIEAHIPVCSHTCVAMTGN
jgi:hypothetical protein